MSVAPQGIGRAEDSGPSLFGVQVALHGALWSFGHLLRAVAPYSQVDGYDEVETTRMRCESAFLPLEALNVDQDPGRNDPCPAGAARSSSAATVRSRGGVDQC